MYIYICIIYAVFFFAAFSSLMTLPIYAVYACFTHAAVPWNPNLWQHWINLFNFPNESETFYHEATAGSTYHLFLDGTPSCSSFGKLGAWFFHMGGCVA